MKSIDMYNEKCHLIGEMILEGEMANKKHLIETLILSSSDSSNTTQSPM
jgi:hypothetical protein